MKISINTLDDLFAFIKDETNDRATIQTVINHTLKVIVLADITDRNKLIADLKEYYETWKDAEDRPLFLDALELDVIT